jgi:hypothetical protein
VPENLPAVDIGWHLFLAALLDLFQLEFLVAMARHPPEFAYQPLDEKVEEIMSHTLVTPLPPWSLLLAPEPRVCGRM